MSLLYVENYHHHLHQLWAHHPSAQNAISPGLLPFFPAHCSATQLLFFYTVLQYHHAIHCVDLHCRVLVHEAKTLQRCINILFHPSIYQAAENHIETAAAYCSERDKYKNSNFVGQINQFTQHPKQAAIYLSTYVLVKV